MALVQLWGTPGVEVVGISASYGNARLQDTRRITRELLDRWPGAEGRKGAGRSVHVTDGAVAAGRPCAEGVAACVRALESGPLAYLALALLTHLAGVLAERPDLSERIGQVVFVGGRTPGARFFFGWCPYEFHDANVDKDPDAVRRVLDMTVPLTLVPIERAEEALLPQDGLRRAVGRHAAGAWLEARTRNWFRLWRWCAGLPGAPVFDSLAVLAALSRSGWSSKSGRRGWSLSADVRRCMPRRSRAGGGCGLSPASDPVPWAGCWAAWDERRVRGIGATLRRLRCRWR